MARSTNPRRAGCRRRAAIVAAAALMAAGATAGEPPRLALAGFDFRDTSGEVRDQTAEHAARLRGFDATLREGLAAQAGLALVALPCEAARCTARDPGLPVLAAQAEAAGVRFLVFGEVHKMSTLIGWVKFAMLDLQANKPACDRFLSYRGDTDEAWRRAADVTLRNIVDKCLP
ncbi:MAG TPA: DUF2380 domain-containing protein [Paracoccaceae bacterium]|nr:DUF2380 domain-containing protein [Paracoccaceae bacterium]